MSEADKASEALLVHCETCDARVAAAVIGSYEEYVDEPDYSVRFSLVRCSSCAGPMLVTQDDEDARMMDLTGIEVVRWSKPSRMYPEADRRQLGTSVPEPIRQAFAEALSCYAKAKAYTACAIMCRKVLEGICDVHGEKDGTLAARLKVLAERGDLDKRLYNWISVLRTAGNEAAHDVGVTISKDDASDLLDFTEAVAEYLFTFKDKFDSFQQRRADRKKKPPANADFISME